MGFQAHLHYLPYPPSFAEELGIPKAEMISIAAASGSNTVQAKPINAEIGSTN
jgi:hypothetical protein